METNRREFLMGASALAAGASPLAAQAGKPIRIAMIGTGTRAWAHLAILKSLPGYQVVALADPTPENLDKAATLAPGAKTYSDYKKLLAERKDVDAVVIATGNDWRAIEAGAHTYAARSGKYTSLSQWGTDKDGNLVGTLEMPMAVGTVGGATKVHPTARAALKIMGAPSARELAEIIVSVGLAQNFAAIRALATEGIQRGHMSLHARQLAMAAGAEGDEIQLIAAQMVKEQQVRLDRAQALVEEIKSYIPKDRSYD